MALIWRLTFEFGSVDYFQPYDEDPPAPGFLLPRPLHRLPVEPPATTTRGCHRSGDRLAAPPSAEAPPTVDLPPPLDIPLALYESSFFSGEAPPPLQTLNPKTDNVIALRRAPSFSFLPSGLPPANFFRNLKID